MKKTSKRTIIPSVILLISIIGGIVAAKNNVNHKKQEAHEEMVREVNKHADIIKYYICNEDSHHKIKSFQIDAESVKRNPMGGINVSGTVNRDKNLNWFVNIDRDTDSNSKTNGEVIVTSGGESAQLDDLVNGSGSNGK